MNDARWLADLLARHRAVMRCIDGWSGRASYRPSRSGGSRDLIAARRGVKKAIMPVARSILTAIYHMIRDTVPDLPPIEKHPTWQPGPKKPDASPQTSAPAVSPSKYASPHKPQHAPRQFLSE